MLGALGGQGSGERVATWLQSQLGEECRGQTEDPQSVWLPSAPTADLTFVVLAACGPAALTWQRPGWLGGTG